MFGITSESTLTQAHILLVLAVIWLLMALIAKKHRTLTVIIYSGVGILFELSGLYGIWKYVSGFFVLKIGVYIIAALLFLLFVVLLAAIWLKYQETILGRNGCEEYKIPDRKLMDDEPSQYGDDGHVSESENRG